MGCSSSFSRQQPCKITYEYILMNENDRPKELQRYRCIPTIDFGNHHRKEKYRNIRVADITKEECIKQIEIVCTSFVGCDMFVVEPLMDIIPRWNLDPTIVIMKQNLENNLETGKFIEIFLAPWNQMYIAMIPFQELLQLKLKFEKLKKKNKLFIYKNESIIKYRIDY